MSPRQRPVPTTVLDGLKDFQRRTVEHVHHRFYLDQPSTDRFLVADEVGLGKTMVARGVTALALDHLWEETERLDVIYICSNAEIARQNINRLRLNKDLDYTKPTRLSLLPREIKDLKNRKLNFLSLTPGTSFETHSAMGRAEERQVLFILLREAWGLKGKRAWNIFAGAAKRKRFRELTLWHEEHSPIDGELWDRFLRDLESSDKRRKARGEKPLRSHYEDLESDFSKHRTKTTDQKLLDKQRHLLGELRRELARSCVDALEPDIVILDEFQRFKHLLTSETEAGELAHALFDYRDPRTGEGAKTLLLSATPYKAYVTSAEVDDVDHYEDFLQTARFLLGEGKETEELHDLLGEFRRLILRWGEHGSRSRLTDVKQRIEEILRGGIARTERLAHSPDRDGMLREAEPTGVQLRSSDIHAYKATQDVAHILERPDTMEFWKSSPYLLNVMDAYKVKEDLLEVIEAGPADEAYAEIAEILAQPQAGLVDWSEIESYGELDPGNARMRSLASEALGSELWKLLWMPPSLPYYGLGGPFASDEAQAFTKRLVFSSWAVAPKAISVVLSYLAERQMARAFKEDARNDPSERKNRGQRLRIGFDPKEQRLIGMPVLALTYPSLALAELLDPATMAASAGPDFGHADALATATEQLREHLAPLVADSPKGGRPDERWYWAAPLLLDAARDRSTTLSFLRDGDAVDTWAGGSGRTGDDAGGTHWRAHVAEAELGALGELDPQLGAPPDDLAQVVAKFALAGPGVVALRAFARGYEEGEPLRSPAVRTAAARVAWSFRSLFNLPEVTELIRGQYRQGTYWREVLRYCVEGCLQSVLDEFVHVQTESQGHISGPPDPDVTAELADKISDAVGIRTTRASIDVIESDGRKVQARTERMRARYALRFGDQTGDDGAVLARADSVRTAFNSPFWPFVLASTSVGQEGLDFHLYSHTVVHWNLPSNPVDLEQREGRVHRYKGHAIRKNVASSFGRQVLAEAPADPWRRLFELAEATRPEGQSELWPYWIFLGSGSNGDKPATIVREVPTLPLSRDRQRLADLKDALTLYRSVLGQARQEDVLRILEEKVPREERDDVCELLRIDLTPPVRPALELPARVDRA